MSRVVVCGSLNMDVVVQSARRPVPGETLLGATVSFLPGGKGLNQAVAAARLGVPTAMIGAVGNDAFANSLRGFLADNDIDCSGVREIDGPATGVALIQVAQKDNAITVASGANLHFTKEMVHQAPRDDEVWVAQFETPIAATEAILKRARAKGARTVVATLGERGAVVVTADGATAIPAFKAKVVDTTGAGDCFVGALAARMSAGATPVEAARYASAAASCSVERLGAAPSMPTAREVAARLARA